jgi:F-type H+-transporting ATPase subunit b
MSFSLLLLAATDGASSGNGMIHGLVNQAASVLNDFGVEKPLLLAQIVNFAIVAFLLWKFAFKPVMATIDARKKAIDDGLRYTEELKAKLEAAQQTTEAQIREAGQKSQQIVAEAQKIAREISDKQQKEAVEKANAVLTKAQAAIELEKNKMLAEARVEIARLVVATTERVLAKELSEADRARYNASAARELTSV